MTLNLKGLDKRGRNAIYTGAAVSIRMPLGAFPDKTPPATLDVAGLAGPKPKLTAEERKARLAAITPAEKLARLEQRVARMKAKLAAAPTMAAIAAPAPTTPTDAGIRAAKQDRSAATKAAATKAAAKERR